MAAIDDATDGDYEFVKRTYGPELRKHIAFLSVRTGWNDLSDPETLPENIMSSSQLYVRAALPTVTR